MDMMWYRRRGLMVTPHIESVTGSIASFNSDYNKIPVKSLICDIEPIQEGSGDPSPENVRPISGRTWLTVYHSEADTSDPVTISVNWETEAGTVYGGTLDAVSGKLTVTHKGIVLNGSENWESVIGNYSYVRFKISQLANAVQNESICDRFPRVNLSSVTNYQGFNVYNSGASGGGTFVGIRYDDAFSSDGTDSIKNWLGQNNTTVVYNVLNTTEIQLTPQEIRTLLGVNNIWCDSGNVSVNYWKWGK